MLHVHCETSLSITALCIGLHRPSARRVSRLHLRSQRCFRVLHNQSIRLSMPVVLRLVRVRAWVMAYQSALGSRQHSSLHYRRIFACRISSAHTASLSSVSNVFSRMKSIQQQAATPNHALQRTPGFGVQLPSAAVARPAQSRAVLPAMKPGTARAFALRRRAHSRALGPESLSLGSLAVATRLP